MSGIAQHLELPKWRELSALIALAGCSSPTLAPHASRSVESSAPAVEEKVTA